MKREFRTGNVFKLNDSICIVIVERAVDNRKLTEWISFDYTNCKGITPNITELVDEMCWECDTNDSEYEDFECENCKGTGYFKKERLGMDRAVFLAYTVKDYIVDRLLKNFDFRL